MEIQSREPFRERGVHVNKPSTNKVLISEPKQWLRYSTKEVLKIVQASFNLLWVFLPQKLPIFEINLDLEIRCD